jgi:hypothetical protein
MVARSVGRNAKLRRISKTESTPATKQRRGNYGSPHARITVLPAVPEYLSQCKVLPSDSIEAQQPEFEPVDHSVYLGRERLGRYSRIGPRLYAAFDSKDRLLGQFKTRVNAYAAISIANNAGKQSAASTRRAR